MEFTPSRFSHRVICILLGSSLLFRSYNSLAEKPFYFASSLDSGEDLVQPLIWCGQENLEYSGRSLSLHRSKYTQRCSKAYRSVLQAWQRQSFFPLWASHLLSYMLLPQQVEEAEEPGGAEFLQP